MQDLFTFPHYSYAVLPIDLADGNTPVLCGGGDNLPDPPKPPKYTNIVFDAIAPVVEVPPVLCVGGDNLPDLPKPPKYTNIVFGAITPVVEAPPVLCAGGDNLPDPPKPK